MNPTRKFHCLWLAAALAGLNAVSATAQTTNASAGSRLDYSAFKTVADRNIFDPNRYPRSQRNTKRETRKTKTADVFSLVGVMSYEKGLFVFFDGSSSDYRKVVKPGDTNGVAGFTLAEAAPNQVRLVSGTNEFVLRVGSQMRRDDEGNWSLSAKAEPIVSSTTSASSSESSSAASAGSASDVLKKLMQRREQELNR